LTLVLVDVPLALWKVEVEAGVEEGDEAASSQMIAICTKMGIDPLSNFVGRSTLLFSQSEKLIAS
jgi:hypothetical protein